MKEKWFKRIMAVLLVGMMVLGMVGCGSSSDSEEESSDEADATEESSGSDDAVTIVYNSNMNFDQFDLTGIYDGEINWVPVAENELNQKIMLEMTTGSKSYDICIVPGFGTQMFASMGMLEPLEELDDMSDVFAGSRSQLMIGDDLYGYPIIGDAMVMYINTEMWEAAGYTEEDVPTTLEEYRDCARHLTIDANGVRGDEEGFDKNNVVQWGTMFKGAATNGTVWEVDTLVLSNGGCYVEKDYDTNTCEVKCNSPEFVDTLQYIVDMADEGIIPSGFASYDYDEVDAQWMTGNIGMYITWPYLATKGEGSAVDGKVAAYQLPVGLSGKGVTCLGGWAFHVFTDAPHKEAAFECVKALGSADASYAYCTWQGSSSARRSVVEKVNEGFEEEGNTLRVDVNNAYMVSCEDGHECDIAMTGEAANDAQTTAGQYINMAFTGQLTCQEAMDQLKEELEQILADNDFMQGN